MLGEEIKDLAENQPFRPFTVRLSNGAEYTFAASRDFGAPKDYHYIVYFGEKNMVIIDAESVTEIFKS